LVTDNKPAQLDEHPSSSKQITALAKSVTIAVTQPEEDLRVESADDILARQVELENVRATITKI
jgi:hypothetical protein